MSIQPTYDAGEGLGGERRERLPGPEHEARRSGRWRVAGGTFACPSCDLPLGVGGGLDLTAEIGCPYCAETALARDFLTIGESTRPARVAVVASLPLSP